MGLGKTLQMIAVLSLFCAPELGAGLGFCRSVSRRSALVISPAVVVGNWQAEFRKWLSPEQLSLVSIVALEDAKVCCLVRPLHSSSGFLRSLIPALLCCFGAEPE